MHPPQLIYLILNPLSTKQLVALTTVSRRFHALALRLIHNRLTLAASLDDHTLILECYHPSAKLTAGHLFCRSLGTHGLEDALDHGGGQEVGKVARLGRLYTKFRPQRREVERSRRPRAGDIPGSRTYPSTAASIARSPNVDTDVVAETVSLEAHELFSQLCTVINLAKIGAAKGLIMSIVEVSDGMIRIWRDWMAKQASATLDSGHASGSASSLEYEPCDPCQDPTILWVNNSNDAVGIKFRVREHKWRRDNPILFASEDEVAVSYSVEFQGQRALRKNFVAMTDQPQNCLSRPRTCFSRWRNRRGIRIIYRAKLLFLVPLASRGLRAHYM